MRIIVNISAPDRTCMLQAEVVFVVYFSLLFWTSSGKKESYDENLPNSSIPHKPVLEPTFPLMGPYALNALSV